MSRVFAHSWLLVRLLDIWRPYLSIARELPSFVACFTETQNLRVESSTVFILVEISTQIQWKAFLLSQTKSDKVMLATTRKDCDQIVKDYLDFG